MKTSTYLQNIDKAINHLDMRVIEHTLQDLKNLRRRAETVDLGGNNALVMERLDDLISVTRDTINEAKIMRYVSAHLTQTQISQFKEDLVDLIGLIYYALDRPDFKCSQFLAECTMTWRSWRP